jgi:hypothetical protein
VRFLATLLMWVITTVLLALAVPAVWAQQNIVDSGGYAALAQGAAENPDLQSAMATELADQALRLGGSNVNSRLIKAAAETYTASPAFPGQFAQANRYAHGWLFTDSIRGTVDSEGRWIIDIAPMLSDASFRKTLDEYRIKVPATLPIPLTDKASSVLRPGVLRPAASWGPVVSIGIGTLAIVWALLTLLIARNRGKILVALGFSGLLVGAAGWIGIELGRGYVDAALGNTSGNIRRLADAMVAAVEESMHHWLNMVLIGGGALAIVGVLVALIAGLFKPKPAPGNVG